ncbi:hypothetical protein [Streptomyces sp. NPDC054794]
MPALSWYGVPGPVHVTAVPSPISQRTDATHAVADTVMAPALPSP